jgi:hypothetical protein
MTVENASRTPVGNVSEEPAVLGDLFACIGDLRKT